MSMKVYEQRSRSTYLTTSLNQSPLEPLNGSFNMNSLTHTGNHTSSGQKQIPALFSKLVTRPTSTKEDTSLLIPVEMYDSKKDVYYTIHLTKEELENRESGTVMATPTRQPTSTEIQTQAKVLSSLKTFFQLTKLGK